MTEKKSLAEIEFETRYDVWVAQNDGPLLTPDGHVNTHAVYRKSSEVVIGAWRDRRLKDIRYYRKPTDEEVKILAKIEFERRSKEESMLQPAQGDTKQRTEPEPQQEPQPYTSLDAKMQEARRRGGRASKLNMAILEAAKELISQNQKLQTASLIAKNFKKYKSTQPYEITVDSMKYEIYCDGNKIYSSCANGNKGKYNDKSIAYSTFQSTYIPKAKREVDPLKGNNT